MFLRVLSLIIVFVAILLVKAYGQMVNVDSLSIADCDKVNYESEWQQVILPASLVGVGAVTLASDLVRSYSHEITNNVIDIRGNANRLEFDDYIQYLPLTGALMLEGVGGEARHSFRDRTLILCTSYATLGVLTNVSKLCILEARPEFISRNSFPSGHTATAFMGAELVRMEYGGWYGVGAYAIATSVGFMRMYNGRHWLHDVVAGAGVGILSARVGEWSCQLWQKLLFKEDKDENALSLMPIAAPVDGGYYGFTMVCNF